MPGFKSNEGTQQQTDGCSPRVVTVSCVVRLLRNPQRESSPPPIQSHPKARPERGFSVISSVRVRATAGHVLDSVPSVCFAYRLSLQLLPHSSRVLQCDGTVNKIIFDLVHPSFLFQVYLEKKIIFSFRLHDLRIPACRY